MTGVARFRFGVIPAPLASEASWREKAGTQYTVGRRWRATGWCAMKVPCVYILASRRNGTLYAGVTSNLFDRVSKHKQDLIEGFTQRYGVHRLVYYEMRETMPEAIRREKQIKEWKRLWKIRLIESMNPEWIDLFDERTGEIREGPADRLRATGK